MTKVERPRRLARWISWLVVLLLVLAIAVVFLSTAREWVLIAAMLGLVAAWLVSALVRLGRRRPVAAVVTAVVVVVAGVCTGGTLFYWSFVRDVQGDPVGVPGTVTVRYFASSQLDGTAITLTETIVIDDESGAAVTRIFGPLGANEDTDLMQDPEGWVRSSPVDGFATYTRNRTVAPSKANLISSTVTVPLDLGQLRVRGGSVLLLIRDGSRVVLTTPKGAIGSSFPGSTATDPRHDGGEATTIPVDRDVADITLTVLDEPLRNPAGHQLYDAVTWGPLPWLIGTMVAFVGSVFWDRVLRLVGLAGRRRARTGGATPAAGAAAG